MLLEAGVSVVGCGKGKGNGDSSDMDVSAGTVWVQTWLMWRWTIFAYANSTSKETGPLECTMTAAIHWGPSVRKLQTNTWSPMAKWRSQLERSWSCFCRYWDFSTRAARLGCRKSRQVFNRLPLITVLVMILLCCVAYSCCGKGSETDPAADH